MKTEISTLYGIMMVVLKGERVDKRDCMETAQMWKLARKGLRLERWSTTVGIEISFEVSEQQNSRSFHS